MENRSGNWKLVLVLALLGMVPTSHAQQAPPTAQTASHAPVAETGIRTDRLTPRQLRTWRAIERIVFAKDGSGQFRHPRLHGLWQWVGTSSHVIYVELPDPKDRCDHQAGKFKVEKYDPDGQKYTALIRLCLPVIDRALIRKRARGISGFIQYEGLGKEERYAEALGHELAHAVWILGDRNHARLIEDLEMEVNAFHTCRRNAVQGVTWDEQARQLLKRIESLTTRIELPAETVEEEIWQELLRNQ
jgi:hypothetical protein